MASARASAIWVVPAVLTALVVNLPLIYIFVRAGERGLAEYLDTIATPLVTALVMRTLLLVIGAVTLAIVIALPVAWLVVRTDLPGRRLWALLAALPIVFPSYVAAFTLVAVWGPKGAVQSWLTPFGVERLPELVYGYTGALCALGFFTYPYVFLPLVAALRELDPALEESARSLGASRWRCFMSVVLPQLQPALYAGTLLVALYTLADFGAVSIVRYNTFTLAIYNAYSTLFDRTVAASLATVLVLLTLFLITAEALLAHRQRPHRHRPIRPAERIPLGRWRWPCLGLLSVLALLTLVMPAGVIVFWGLRGLTIGHRPGQHVWQNLGESIVGSLTVSAWAALAAVVLSIPIAVWSVRYRGKLSRVVERLTYAGYALPGLVIALSLVFFSIRYLRPLYQSLPLLALAYVVRFQPQATAATRSALVALSPVFEETARSLGKTPAQILRGLVLPMILPGLLTGGALVFLTSMKELPATLLLRPTGFETLATDIWSYAAEAIYSAASLPALVLIAVTAGPLYLLVIRPILADRVGDRTPKPEILEA